MNDKQRQFDFFTTKMLLAEAAELRDLGLLRATDHAEQVNNGWTEQAVDFVRAFAVLHKGHQFTGEDVRLFAESKGFLIPPHKRAWGNVMLTAAKRDLIHKVGYQKTNNPQAHEAVATLWEGR